MNNFLHPSESKKDSSSSQLQEIEMKLQKSEAECKAFTIKIKSLEEKLVTQENSVSGISLRCLRD